MKTVEYNLLTKPWKKINLPETAIEEADSLMNKIKECKTHEEVNKLVRENPNLNWMYEIQKSALIIKSNYLRHSNPSTPRSMKFKDEVYLIMGEYYADRKLKEVKDLSDEIGANLNDISLEIYPKRKRK